HRAVLAEPVRLGEAAEVTEPRPADAVAIDRDAELAFGRRGDGAPGFASAAGEQGEGAAEQVERRQPSVGVSEPDVRGTRTWRGRRDIVRVAVGDVRRLRAVGDDGARLVDGAGVAPGGGPV